MTAPSLPLTLDMKLVLSAVPSAVFAAFSAPSLGFDPRGGASHRIEMQPPEGDPFHLTGKFLEVDAPARLAYEARRELHPNGWSDTFAKLEELISRP
jgi:uncharacterized protein YndB with AHSA1/START domain